MEEEGRLPNCLNRDMAGENQEAGRDMKGKRRLTERKQEERQNGTSEFENHNVQKFTAKTSLQEFVQKLLIKTC
jgi:hypothetical protein